MNEHAGPACALSVLIVGVFAILLHDKIHAVSPQKPVARTDMSPVPEVKGSPPRIATPGPGRVGPIASRSSESPTRSEEPTTNSRPDPSNRQITAVGRPPSEAASGIPRETPDRMKIDETLARPRTRTPPRSAFTVVLLGETLADVSSRVYGSSDSAEALWRANRDRLARIDSTLTGGMLLRTP